MKPKYNAMVNGEAMIESYEWLMVQVSRKKTAQFRKLSDNNNFELAENNFFSALFQRNQNQDVSSFEFALI